jgi:hypothetical protein
MTLHQHDPDRGHPSPAAPWSLLRMSSGGRLLAALAVAAVLWAAVWWVMS